MLRNRLGVSSSTCVAKAKQVHAPRAILLLIVLFCRKQYGLGSPRLAEGSNSRDTIYFPMISGRRALPARWWLMCSSCFPTLQECTLLMMFAFFSFRFVPRLYLSRAIYQICVPLGAHECLLHSRPQAYIFWSPVNCQNTINMRFCHYLGTAIWDIP